MKIYLHIVNNRPFMYCMGKDSEATQDLKEFLSKVESITKTTFSQLNDRCEDNLDFFAADGRSQIHVLDVTPDNVKNCSD